MKPPREETVVEVALAEAARAGAEALVRLDRSRSVKVVFRDGELEEAKASDNRSLTCSLFVDGRFAAHNTGDLRPESIRAFIEDSIRLTRALEPDPLRGLVPPKRHAVRPGTDLELCDPVLKDRTADDWTALAVDLTEATRKAIQAEGLTKAAGTIKTSAYGGFSRTTLATSNGFWGVEEATGGGLYILTTLTDPDGDRLRTGLEGRDRLFWSDLTRPGTAEDLARRSLERARESFGARPGPSGPAELLVENRAARRLVGALVSAMTGLMLRQGRSFLKGRRGEKIASGLLTVRDEPGLKKRLGSRWFDDEGAAALPMDLIENGVLKNYYLDQYSARRLELTPTVSSPSNIVFIPSRRGGFEEMKTGLKRGLAATEFLGGNHNSTTGNFSFGVGGSWIEDGRAVHAVERMNIAGNFFDLWSGLTEIGDDFFKSSNVMCPSLLFSRVQLSGA